MGWFDEDEEAAFQGISGPVSPWAAGGRKRQALAALAASMQGRGSYGENMANLEQSQAQAKMRELQMLQAQHKMGVQRHLADIFSRGQAAGQPTSVSAGDFARFDRGQGGDSEGPPQAQPGRDPRKLWADMYRQAGDYAASVGMNDEAKNYWERAEKLNPTPKFGLDPTVVMTDQGLRFMVTDDQGGKKLIEGVTPPQEIAREVVVPGPNGPQKLLVDKQGNEIKRFDEYVAPVAVNAGDRQVFTTPQAGVEVPINLSPAERQNIEIARGNLAVNQGNLANSQRRLTLEQQRLEQDRRAAAADRAPDGTKLPAGMRWNAEKGAAEHIPGTKGDVERKEEVAARENRDHGAFVQADLVLGKVDEALANVGFTTAGLGGALAAKVPGSPARDLRADLDTIKANLGFQELQAMRQASPTGGALGQVAVKELDMLQATIASLDPEQSPAALKKGLQQVQHHYNRWKYLVNKDRQMRGLAPITTQKKGREASGKVVDFGSLK